MQKAHRAVDQRETRDGVRLVEEKKRKFLHHSEALFSLNQKQMLLQEELRKLKKRNRHKSQNYLRGQRDLALLKAEITYRRDYGNEQEALELQMVLKHNEEVEKCREELQSALKEYHECRRSTKRLQEEINNMTDASRRETLNFISFCRYAQSIARREIRKVSTERGDTESKRTTLPRKQDIASCRTRFATQAAHSAHELSTFYRRSIGDFRRQERILLGKTKEIIEKTMGKEASRRFASSGADMLDEAQQVLTSAAGITLNHAAAGINSNNLRKYSVSGDSAATQHAHANSVENRFVQRLIDDPQSILGPSAATAANQRMSQKVPKMETPESSTNVNAPHVELMGDFTSSRSHRSPFTVNGAVGGTATTSTGDAREDVTMNRLAGRRSATANRSAAAAVAAVQLSGLSPIADPKQTSQSGRAASSASLVSHRAGVATATPPALMSATGPVRRLLSAAPVANTTGRSPTKRRALQKELFNTCGGSEKKAEELLQALQSARNSLHLFDESEFPAAVVSANHEPFPPHSLLELSPDPPSPPPLPAARNYMVAVGTPGLTADRIDTASASMRLERESIIKRLHDEWSGEAMAQVALQLAKAEGKYRQLSAIKEALDLHLIKQAHLLMLLAGDLNSEFGMPIPEVLNPQQGQKVDLIKLQAALACPPRCRPATRHSALLAAGSSGSTSIAAVAAAVAAAAGEDGEENANQCSGPTGREGLRDAALSLLVAVNEADGTTGAISGRYRFRVEQLNENHALIGKEVERDFYRAETNIRNVLTATADMLNIV